jgi:hypothetical protein
VLTADEFELILSTDLAARTAGGGLIAGWKTGIIRGFREKARSWADRAPMA